MHVRIKLVLAFMLIMTPGAALSQASGTVMTETFDSSEVLPAGWYASGFELSSSIPRSDPNCILARGNMQTAILRTHVIDPTTGTYKEFSWYERRSGSAVPFALIVSFVTERSVIPLDTFDTIGSINAYRRRIVDLEQHQDILTESGRIELMISEDSLNSTGVVRIDDVTLTFRPLYDLSIHIPPILPQPLFLGEDRTLFPDVINLTTHTARDAWIRITTRRQDADPVLSIQDYRIPAIPGLDTLVISHVVTPDLFGTFEVTAEVIWDNDQDASNNSSTSLITVSYPPGSLLISEFMFAPTREDEPEWIEIYNPGPHIIEPGNLTVSDKGTQRPAVGDGVPYLVPGEYMIISSSSALADLYDIDTVPWTIVRIPSLNNTTADAVVFRDAFGTTLDSVMYDPAWGHQGLSIERRDWDLPSSERSTWGPSIAPHGATPGCANSIQRVTVNASLDSMRAVLTGNVVRVRANIRNTGRTMISGKVKFRFTDSRSDHTEFIGIGAFSSIREDNSAIVEIMWEPEISGVIHVHGILDVLNDEVSKDDSLTTEISLPYPTGSLLVNEIMFDPLPGYCEWIEVQNMTDHAVSLLGWKLLDLPTPSGARTKITLDTSFIIPARTLGVIAGDKSIFSAFPWLTSEVHDQTVLVLNRTAGLGLNADTDGIVIADLTGRQIDSVTYSDTWHSPAVDTKGRSLERIRTDLPGTQARAWTSAPGPSRASPGLANRALPPQHVTRSRVSIGPNPFSPDSDGYEDLSYIRYEFPVPTVFVRVRVFDDRGRDIRTLAGGELMSGTDLFVWDGLNDSGSRVHAGPYILYLEAWNEDYRYSTSEKRVIVVAR